MTGGGAGTPAAQVAADLVVRAAVDLVRAAVEVLPRRGQRVAAFLVAARGDGPAGEVAGIREASVRHAGVSAAHAGE